MPSPPPMYLLKKLFVLAFLGFLVVVLAGPILVLAFFATLGLSVYFLVRIGLRGKEPAKRAASELAAATSRVLHRLTSGVNRRVRVRPGPGGGTELSSKLSENKLIYAGRIVLEAVSGAAVGAVLSGALWIYAGWAVNESKGPIVLGALAGCFLGLVLGASRKRVVYPGSTDNA